MEHSKPILELREIVKQYPAFNGGESVSVLRGVNLTVQAGEAVAIIGPSGSGKSTLLQIIGTLDAPTTGEVLLDGENLAALNPEDQALLRNRRIGFVFQSHHLLPQCSVIENVLVPTLADPGAEGGREAEQRARQLLERVGLRDRVHHRPAQLSGGERQRVAVVRAFINQPDLILADEPTGALDRAAAENLTELLVELNREKRVTLLVVTHAIALAKNLDRALELRDGKLESAGLA